MDVHWIKIVTDIFENEKIMLIEKRPRADSILVIWFKLLCLAGKINNGGVFLINDTTPYTHEMFAAIFRRPVSLIKQAFEVFLELGMIKKEGGAVVITNWGKYQDLDKLELIKEQTRRRVAEYRRRKRAKAGAADNECLADECNVTVTLPVTQCNAADIDKEKDKEKDIEKDAEAEAAAAAEDEDALFGGDGGDNDDYDALKLIGGRIGKGVVMLSDRQFEDLLERVSLDEFNYYVEKLADYIINNNARVKSHYATILKWIREDRAVQK